MDVIEVVQNTFGPPLFKSLSSAVGHVSPRDERAALDSERLQGVRIVSGTWTDEQLTLALSNGLALTILAHKGVADWSIGEGGNSVSEQVAADVVELKFESGARVMWDRRSLLDHRIGKRIKRICANEAWLFLYIEDVDILLFSVLQKAHTHEPLLEWSETD